MQDKLLEKLDINYSYDLAKRMEHYRTNKVLGYRTAGSKAEWETGEMLRLEMIRLGLSDVTKDEITVDAWDFKKAVLSFYTANGEQKQIQLGAYQTEFITDDFEAFTLKYVGKGTAADYEDQDVTGKIVLVDINQRDEWWINYPVYQAHLKGAKAVIAAQTGGYGEVDEEALNAQDIAGPEDAPAFSISRKDADLIKTLLDDNQEMSIWLDADTRITRDHKTYNITGCIPGKHSDRYVLLSAHYDSYFDGFQDDNTAVSMMFGIAKAFLDSGYQPNNTILLAAMAAEEWGVSDTNFDWSTGAYEEVFTVHPDWAGKVVADLNFELPALAHGTRARIRSCYEYIRFLNAFLLELPTLTQAYPEEPRVVGPIETWSDDFSIAISGIPSMVNDFTGGSFMATHYHSQFDNDTFYDEQVYRLHHEIFTLLIDTLDRTAVVPLCFTPVFKHAYEALDDDYDFLNPITKEKMKKLSDLLHRARDKARTDYEEVKQINDEYADLLIRNSDAENNDSLPESVSNTTSSLENQLEALFSSSRALETRLLKQFKAEQDAFVRIDWYGNVLYPHEILIQKLMLIDGTIRNLRNRNISSALRKLYQMDNNAYAFCFDEEVFRHFSNYVFHQPRERLKWGYGRLMEHQNMYDIVSSLLHKEKTGCTDYKDEISHLEVIFHEQSHLLEFTIDELCKTVSTYFI